ncbi:MAG TPA: hypothetical protein VMF56_02835 [Acidobacteriaceae bacterium]|nr:hypothetical protein [Acidobacteriaceae bacterium]
MVFRYTAPSLVARYRNFPLGVPAIAVGDAGARTVDWATLLTLPEAIGNVPIVPVLAFET